MNNIAIIALVFMTGLCWGVVSDDSMWSDKCKQGGMVTRDDELDTSVRPLRSRLKQKGRRDD